MKEGLKVALELVDKSSKIDNEKNKLFLEAKNETENTFKKTINQLKEIMDKVESSEVSNKNLESIDFMSHQIVVTPAVEKRNMSM